MDSGKIMYMRNTDISNILIIGCGGAGLRAAIEAKNNNLSVKILGKRTKMMLIRLWLQVGLMRLLVIWIKKILG